LPFEETIDASGSTLESSEPVYTCGVYEIDHTVWYSYTPSSSGYFLIDTANSFYNTVLHVFEVMEDDSLALVGCNDDKGWDYNAQISINGVAGKTYLVSVGGSTYTGTLSISFEDLELFTSCNAVDVSQSECETLGNLYTELGGDSWSDRTGWFETNRVCTWYGISCQGENINFY
jgi:hypothetical protein